MSFTGANEGLLCQGLYRMGRAEQGRGDLESSGSLPQPCHSTSHLRLFLWDLFPFHQSG